MDLMRRGFLRAIQGVLRCVEDGLVHGGPPCSSWIWVNAGTSKRTALSYWGNPDEPSVATANECLGCRASGLRASGCDSCCVLRICSRWALLAILAVARCLHVVVEQPRSSLMPKVKYFRVMSKVLGKRVKWTSCN